MIEKQEVYTQIELLESGEVQLRKTTKLIEDGQVISQSHHRVVLNPGADVSIYPQNIQDICGIFWTDEIIEAFNNRESIL